MSLREEITKQLRFYNTHVGITDESYISQTDKILKLIEKRIDNMIKVDDETIDRKSYKMYDEGRIAAIASKNTLTLVKEMLK